ncbi:MFS transporter [Blastococcus saxobsidens]|nr:MFS transporter [Blastococcus saxobsidens]
MAVGPLPVFALSALSPLVTRELGLSVAEFGALSTLSFAVAAPSAWLLGRSVDRFPPRLVMVSLAVASGIALALTAYARSFGWLVAGVVLAGVAMAGTNPVTNRVVSSRVAADERGPIMGAKQSGVQLGQFLAGLTLPPIAVVLGWRAAVATAALLVLAGLALTYRFILAAPAAARAPGPTPPAAPRSPQIWGLLAYSFFSGAALQSTNAYLPLFGFERLSFSVASAGLLVAVMGGIGLVARMAWGRATGRSADPRRILTVMATCGAAAMAVLVAAAWWQVGWLLWVAAAVTGATVVASNVVVMMAVVRLSDQQSVGTASGLLSLGLYAGFAVGPISFGALVEETDYATGWAVTAALYAVAGAVIAASQRSRSPQRPRLHPSAS